mgnify:CR=1 FL=1
MVCPQCHGIRTVQGPWMPFWGTLLSIPVPCPYCGGLGTAPCCEGSERGGQLEDTNGILD